MVEAPSSTLEREIEEISGEKVRLCYQCGKCSTGCLFSSAMDVLPHQTMKLIRYGRKRRLLSSHAIWTCASCVTCTARCPNGIDVARVMDALREMALREGVEPAEKNIAVFHRCFLANVKAAGRVSEPVLMGSYKFLSRDLLGDLGLAAEMLRKRKIRFIPSVVWKRREIRRIFEQSKENGA
jgi:heterodisulfide reductase subunit C